MTIFILPLLLITVIVILVFKVFVKESTSGFNESIEEFKDKELQANYTIKSIQNLQLNYVYSNKAILPFKEYQNDKEFRELIKKQAQVKRKCDLDMIKLPLGFNNTDIKANYGINNFDKIVLMEEHYNGYIRALFEWAKALYDFGNKQDCKIILEECIRLEGDISQIYIIISDIFFEEKNKNSLINLKKCIINYELTFKDKVLKYIEHKINLLN